jgi:chromosome segregation ATPase
MTSRYNNGRVDERLAGHDSHFKMINGSLKEIAANLASLNLSMQRMEDSAKSDRATVVTTAKALREAEDARRDKGEARWTPVQRLTMLLGSMGAVVGVLYDILHH